MKYLFILLISFLPNFGMSLEVSATVSPLHVLLSAVSKGALKPNLIMKHNLDSPHGHQLTPSSKHLIQNSDVIFYLSTEFELFAQKNKTKNWVELLPLMPHVINTTDHQQDMHIWLDPDNAMVIAQVMADTLAAYDKKNASLYQKNAQQLVNNIKEVVTDIKEMFSHTNNVQYAIVHDAYSYFAKYFKIPAGMILLKNHQEHMTPKAFYNLQSAQGLRCIVSDPYHQNVIPRKISQNNRLVIVDPLGQGEKEYTDLLYSIAGAFQKCFNE